MYIYRFCWTCGHKRTAEKPIVPVSMNPKYCKYVDSKKIQYRFDDGTLCNYCLHPWLFLMPSS